MSDAKVLRLASVQADEDVVEMAQRLLAEAKSGQIIALAYVAVTPGGGTAQAWGGESSLTTLCGAAHELAATITLASISALSSK